MRSPAFGGVSAPVRRTKEERHRLRLAAIEANERLVGRLREGLPLAEAKRTAISQTGDFPTSDEIDRQIGLAWDKELARLRAQLGPKRR
jgi:hypothetical protein